MNPASNGSSTTTTAAKTDGPVQMRNGDSNNAGSFSSDYVGGSHRWPDGTFDPVSFAKLPAPRRGLAMPFRQLYELREGIFQDHLRYQKGHLYFLANDPQVPADLRNSRERLGTPCQRVQGNGPLAAPALRPRGPPHGLRLRHDPGQLPIDRDRKRLGRPRLLRDGLALLPARGGGGER